MTWHPFRNAGLKVAALGLGILLWMTVSGQQVERSVVVQLQFRNVPTALEITGDAPRTVNVRLQGSTGLISRLDSAEVVVTVDLTAARPGVRVFPLTVDDISVPLGVQVKSVDPATVSLTLEKTATAEVPVKPTIDGDPAPGYDVVDVKCDPATVTAVGPESRVKEGPDALTERISISGARATIVENVSMAISDPAVRLRNPRPARVTVTIAQAPVTPFIGRTVAVRNAAPGSGVTVSPETVTVDLRASQSVLKGLADTAIAPYVDAAGLRPGRYNLPVRMDSSTDYVVTGFTPATVAVRVR